MLTEPGFYSGRPVSSIELEEALETMVMSVAHDLTPEDLQKVMSNVDIPACPAVVADAMAEAQKDEPDLKRLSSLIAADPGMTAAALKLATSPLFGSHQPVSGARQAVERLGIKNVVCIIIGVALRSSITGLPSSWLEQFWRRNTQLAVAAALVARRQFGISPDAAYTYTLFHDAAIPLMMKRFPDYGKALDLAKTEGVMLVEAERSYFPCTHPVVGSLLVRNWGLPPILGQAIRFHHEPDAYDLPDRTLPGGALSFIAVTHVAEHLAAEFMQETDVEVGPELFARAMDYLGISEGEMDDLRARIELALQDAAA